MAVLLILVGGVLVICGVRGTLTDLMTQLQSDFSGSASFLPWVFAITIIGLFGYWPPTRKPANALIVLVLAAFLLSKSGANVWENITAVLKQGVTPAVPTSGGSSSGGSDGIGSDLSFVEGLVALGAL